MPNPAEIAAKLTKAQIECPVCAGQGFHEWQEAVCCQNPTPHGECCGMPVGEWMQAPCDICGGSGQIEELAVRAHLEKNDDRS